MHVLKQSTVLSLLLMAAA